MGRSEIGYLYYKEEAVGSNPAVLRNVAQLEER